MDVQSQNMTESLPSEDMLPWYAIRLFSIKQKAVCEYLSEQGLQYFVPMQYVDFETRDGKRKRELRPVVRNLVFVKKSITQRKMTKLMQESPYKMAVLRKNRHSTDYYEISSKEMREFQLMCNPEIELRKYLTEEEAHLKVGTQVDVVFGPLKGLSGKLVRQSHKYYLLKEIPGMGVMIKVSRWCCKPVAEK